MQSKDLIRELVKVSTTLDKVTEYLETQSEANAMLHMSDKVMYPPLTSAAGTANRNLADLILRLNAEENEDG